MKIQTIIVCHIFQYYNNDLCSWFNVGVPLFFIISGYLYGLKYNASGKGTIDFIKKTYKKILFPYWTFLVFAVAFFYLYPDSGIKPSIRYIILALIGADTLPSLRYLWFVPYILFCYILVPYLHSIVVYCKGKDNFKAFGVYLIVIISLQVLGFTFKSFFLPDRFVAFVIAFFLPDIFSRISLTSKKVFTISSISVGIIAWIVRYWVRYAYSGSFTQIAGLYDRYSMVVAAFAVFFSLMFLFRRSRFNHLLNLSDRLSYPVYLVHGIFIFGPVAVLALTPYLILNIVLLFILILIFALVIEKTSNIIKNYCK